MEKQTIALKELKKNIEHTFSELCTTLAAFSNEQINTVPFEGSWTAGQVAEHIIIAVGGAPQVCQGETQISLRAEDDKIEPLRAFFLDFTQKYTSPDFALPTGTRHDKAEILAAIKHIEKEFENAANTLDLTLTCLSFELPGFGHLTCFEWLDFGLTHAQRHIRQLKNIFKHLNAGN